MKNRYPLKRMLGLLAYLMAGISMLVQAQESGTTANQNAKIFGGRAQYRTWSISPHLGVLSPATILDNGRDYNQPRLDLGYGLNLRKQLGHAFGLEVDFLKGKLSSDNDNGSGASSNNNPYFETELGWTASVLGVVNVATVDFIRRKNQVNFLFKMGYGYAAYSHSVTDEHVQVVDSKGTYGADGNDTYLKKRFIPVGLGAKFKVSNRLNFDLGYNMYFLGVDNLDGTVLGTNNDRWSYTYGALEFSLGKISKLNLDWVNPLALMYDELKDPSLRQELENLKSRVNSLEKADLLKDSDGDGVADKLDKCPDTEAGIRVDGSGCPLDVDADGIPDSKDSCPTEKGVIEFNGCPGNAISANAVLFDFNSSVLKTSAYQILDQLSTDLKSETLQKIELGGHASDEGDREYNLQLSQDRADAVKSYLINSGVQASKITTKGFGETVPVASNETEEGRQLNRRVEIIKQD